MSMLGLYTDEELREELKRRAKIKRANAVRNTAKYAYLKGIVYHIDNICYSGRNWKGEEFIKYKPYSHWTFRLEDMECENKEVLQWARQIYFKCSLPKYKAPKLGDKVVIKVRVPKILMPSNVRNSKIVEIVN